MRATSKKIYLTFTLLSILFFPSFIYADNNNGSCNGELISELNNKTTSTSHNENGSVRKSSDDNDYYYFNINTSGTVSLTYNSSRSTDLYFSNSGCGNNRILNNGTSTSSTLNVSSGDRVYIRVKAESSYNTTYTLSLEFTTNSSTGRDFEQRHQENLFGDVKVIGNTVLCILNSNNQCKEPTSSNSNSDTNLQRAPLSSSTLVIPNTANVEYARIYWQGRRTVNQGWSSTAKNDAGKIKIKKSTSANYTELTADIKDFDSTTNVPIYSASADALNIVTGSGTYLVDTESFFTITGDTSDGLGAYGAWVLVVVYSDPNETIAKNITIFDGYKQVTSSTGNVDIPVNGFLTPRGGDVDSETYVFVGEGDKYISGDKIKMAGLNFNTVLTTLGTFNSRIDVPAARNPDLENNNGIDIQLYDVGTTSATTPIIKNNETGAKFQFSSTQDSYFPSLIVFSTELYLPQMCYDYSLKQDGRYFSIDRATYPKAQIDQQISSSDIEVGVYLRNQESDLLAEGIAIRTDLNITKFDHIGHIYTSNVNGSTLFDRGSPASAGTLCDYAVAGNNSVSNSGCTDGHNIRKGNGSLNANDYVYTQFTIKPKNISGIADINESLGLSVKYYITANGEKIEYPDYVLGGVNVPICEPTVSYQPQWGQFNVVRRGQTNPKNNLYTQVSRKPFDTNVVFDSTPTTGDNAAPISDINTTLLVEIIDMKSFGDINASCGKPDANVSVPLFVPMNINSSNGQSPIPTQTEDYYNFATENTTFRIWYFEDVNQTLLQNWTATTTDDTRSVLQSISGLYKPTVHTLCESECSTPTSKTCFQCIRANYAKPICARDNFSVRPESFSLNIFDVNQTETNEITKDTTKVNISTATGYSPGTIEPVGRINLAAGYNYRFDINASGNDGLALVPRYSQTFKATNESHATLYWDRPDLAVNCNDANNSDVEFFFQDGKVKNQERFHGNVGEYRLNLIDTIWTAVDWDNPLHHIAGNNFDTSADCIENSDITSTLKNGCVIQTNHGLDSKGNFYRDHNLTFHPYKFDVQDINYTVGLNHVVPPVNPYIYMADMTTDENMSIHLNGVIRAVGYNNKLVSNFVDSCYAVGLDLNLSKSDTSLLDINGNNIVYRSTFHNLDIDDATVVLIDKNETDTLKPTHVQILPMFFIKDLNGSINTIHNINYDRNVNAPANPKKILLKTYDVNCTNPLADCAMYADLKGDKNATGRLNIDQNITHYYGRTNISRQMFTTPKGTAADPGVALIYYEVYCNLNTGCDKKLLQGGIDANTTNDPRWFVNVNQTTDFGYAGSINQKGHAVGFGEVTGTASTGNHQDNSNLVYDGSRGYPYKTTMENNASSWLIYNQYTPNAFKNDFTAEFLGGIGSWAGVHETNSSTNANATSKTNRRTMW